MRAIVLVGGEGTRLRPLTWRTAKALVPVLGRPLLDHLLLHLKRHGVTQVTLAMTRRNPQIRDAFGDGARLGIALDYAYEETPLGSGGAIGAIAAGWRETGWNDTFLVANGDVITDLDISAMVERHRAQRAVLSISLHEVEDPSPFGVVDIDGDGRIHRFVEKPAREEAPSLLINAGTWLFEPGLVDQLDPATFHRVEDHLFPSLCAAGAPVFGFHRPAYWADVGTPEALLRVNLDMASGRIDSPLVAGSEDGDGLCVGEGARVADGAITSPSVIGPYAVIEAGAAITRSLLWDHVTVEAGARVTDSILASDVRIGAGATVEHSVLAHGVVIAPGASLRDEQIDPVEEPPPTPARTP